MVAASKVPMLKPGEYELWRMRMEQYIQMVDYALWEVIENGNTAPKTTLVEGVEKVIPPTTTEEKAQRRLELKARNTLLMGIPNEHQLKFNSIKDAKSLLSEVLDQTFDRLQKLISQLEIHGETISQEDVNRKFLRSMSPEWNTHTIMWRNKPEIDTLSLDDLYNNLKIYESEVKGTSSSRTNTQNVPFVSSNNTSNTNGAVNIAHGATTASTQATAPNSLQLDNEDLQQIHPDNLEEMDLRWQMAMLTMRARRFLKNTGRKFSVNDTKTIRFDKSKVECYNCHKKGHFAREYRAPRTKKTQNRESIRRSGPAEITFFPMRLILKDGLDIMIGVINKQSKLIFALWLTLSTSSNFRGLESVEARLLVYKKNESVYEEDIKIVDKCKTGLGYNDVPPPYTGNFMPLKHDLSFSGLEEFVNKPIVSEPTVKKPVVKTSEAKASADKPKAVRKNNGAPIIEDWVSDSRKILPQAKEIQKKTVKHMTREHSYRYFFEEIDGGYVAFGGNPKGGKITGRARTPQQNRVAERKNRTLIEAARTMLADFKLSTTFWAKAVNTACYVQNRVLVTKPHYKTPYKLFLGRKPALGFMRPFGCPVTILNSIDHLGKFDGKVDEGFFVGYSINSLAFREQKHVIMETVKPTSELLKKKVNGDPNKKDERDDQEKDDNVNSIHNINTASDGNITNNVNENKKDERGIVIKNKARLVAQGYTQEEVIDYDEVFAHVARIEAIRLFLAYASFKDFVVYQMDVQSVFIYGKIEEEVYIYQPPGFEDPDFPDRVYKVEKGKIDKTLFIRRDKGDILLVQVYVDDIIFGSTKKSLCTEIEKMMHKKFRMSSMGELTFFLGLQVKQKEDGIFISQDKCVTKILKKFGFTDVKTASTPVETQKLLRKDEDGEELDVYLYRSMIGSLMYLTSSRPDIIFVVCQPKLGLWYPKDSPFDLVAYTDNDYTGASLDRKSTTGGCQFLGCRLISWQCKKQTMVFDSRLNIDSNEKKLIQMIKIHTDKNVADLLTKAFDEIVENGNAPIVTETVDGKETVIPPTSVEEKAKEGQMIEKTYERLQKLISQLGIHGEVIPQEDINQKFLRSLSQEWTMHTIVWRNKPEIETLSLDDLFNNLKAYESEVKGTSISMTNSHNVPFLSSSSTNSATRAVNTARGVNTASTQGATDSSTTVENLSDAVIYSFFASQPSIPQLDNEDLQQINPDDLEDMDLMWNIAMLTIRARRFLKNTGRKFYDWSDQAEEGPTNFALMAYYLTSSTSYTNSELSNDSNCCSSCLECVKDLKEQNEQLVKDLRTTRISVVSYKTGLESVEARLLVFKKIKLCGSGPNWLFDIDALTKSMNYKPVVAGNQSNGNAGTKVCDNAGNENEASGKDNEVPSIEEPREDQRVNQELDASINNTNNINTASDGNNINNVNVVSSTVNVAVIEVNVVDPKTSIELPNDLNMPELEDIVYSDDDEDVGAEADMNNLDAFMPVSPIPTTRIHKDNPKEEVYVCQPSGFEDPDFPDRVYKVEKALYGLHQAPRAWYETLSTYLLENRFQVNPKVSHLHAVKRIFRYLKGQPKLGLLYLKDSPLAYTDSDYAGASLDRKTNDPPLSRVNTLGSGEDRLTLKELMDLCRKLSDRVLDLETTKTTQAKEIASLKKRVKKLERKRKSKTLGMKFS
ncbi:retrovirus-related pol polyprotein from transposon TNT 1-94 [Tanacetum coccineum]